MTSADVAVVGGGVIGLSVAWHAAARGLAVTVVDDCPGRGASWAAAGMLAPVTEVTYGEEALLGLNLRAAACYPEFVARLEEASGRSCGYRPSGAVLVARDADDNAALEQLLGFQRRLGLDVERLRSREVRRLEPGLAPTVRGGILVPGDHQVDNRALVGALLVACERAGVAFTHTRARAVRGAGDTVDGVRLADGDELAAPWVVLAAGWESARLAGVPAGSVPVRPIKGQLLHLRVRGGEPALATRIVRGLEVYAVPRVDGRLVVGATVEERGADRSVTAGGVLELLRRVYELLPGVTELELVETTAGSRPGSPDNAPLLGPAGPAGLVAATGTYRNGVLLAPVVGEAIAGLLATGQPPQLLTPFAPERLGAPTEVVGS